MLKIVPDAESRQQLGTTLDEIARRGAELMLGLALEAEVDDYLDRHRDERNEHGHALVVRNGHARPRRILAGAGTLGVAAPRIDDRRIDLATGERQRFGSVILPPYVVDPPRSPRCRRCCTSTACRRRISSRRSRSSSVPMQACRPP